MPSWSPLARLKLLALRNSSSARVTLSSASAQSPSITCAAEDLDFVACMRIVEEFQRVLGKLARALGVAS